MVVSSYNGEPWANPGRKPLCETCWLTLGRMNLLNVHHQCVSPPTPIPTLPDPPPLTGNDFHFQLGLRDLTLYIRRTLPDYARGVFYALNPVA